MSNSNDRFDRAALRSFFRGDWDEETTRSRTDRKMLTEASEDYSLPTLERNQADRLAQAIVSGIIDQFEINMPPSKDGKKSNEEKELLSQILYHMEKHPDLPAIIYDITMETQVELGGDWEYDQAGNRVDVDDDDGMAAMEVAGSDRAEMVDRIAGAVWDAINDGGWTGEFNMAELDDLADNMIAAGDLDGEMWHASDIDYEEINDRVDEFKDEDDPIGDDIYGRGSDEEYEY